MRHVRLTSLSAVRAGWQRRGPRTSCGPTASGRRRNEFRKKESAMAAGRIQLAARGAAPPRDKEIRNLRARVGGRVCGRWSAGGQRIRPPSSAAPAGGRASAASASEYRKKKLPTGGWCGSIASLHAARGAPHQGVGRDRQRSAPEAISLKRKVDLRRLVRVGRGAAPRDKKIQNLRARVGGRVNRRCCCNRGGAQVDPVPRGAQRRPAARARGDSHP